MKSARGHAKGQEKKRSGTPSPSPSRSAPDARASENRELRAAQRRHDDTARLNKKHRRNESLVRAAPRRADVDFVRTGRGVKQALASSKLAHGFRKQQPPSSCFIYTQVGELGAN